MDFYDSYDRNKRHRRAPSVPALPSRYKHQQPKDQRPRAQSRPRPDHRTKDVSQSQTSNRKRSSHLHDLTNDFHHKSSSISYRGHSEAVHSSPHLSASHLPQASRNLYNADYVCPREGSSYARSKPAQLSSCNGHFPKSSWNPFTDMKRKPSNELFKSPPKFQRSSKANSYDFFVNYHEDNVGRRCDEHPMPGQARNKSASRGYAFPSSQRSLLLDENEEVCEIDPDDFWARSRDYQKSVPVKYERQSKSGNPVLVADNPREGPEHRITQERPRSRSVYPNISVETRRRPSRSGDAPKGILHNGSMRHPHRYPVDPDHNTSNANYAHQQTMIASTKDNPINIISDSESVEELVEQTKKIDKTRNRFSNGARPTSHLYPTQQNQLFILDSDREDEDYMPYNHGKQSQARGKSRPPISKIQREDPTGELSDDMTMEDWMNIAKSQKPRDFSMVDHPPESVTNNESEESLFVGDNEVDQELSNLHQRQFTLEKQRLPKNLKQYLMQRRPVIDARNNYSAPIDKSRQQQNQELKRAQEIASPQKAEEGVDPNEQPRSGPETNRAQETTMQTDGTGRHSRRNAEQAAEDEHLSRSGKDEKDQTWLFEAASKSQRGNQSSGMFDIGASAASVYEAHGIESQSLEGKHRDCMPQQVHTPQKQSHVAEDLARYVEKNDQEKEHLAKQLSDARQRQKILDQQIRTSSGAHDSRPTLEEQLRKYEQVDGDPPKQYDRSGIQSLQSMKNKKQSVVQQLKKQAQKEKSRYDSSQAILGIGQEKHHTGISRKRPDYKDTPLDPRSILPEDKILWSLKNNTNLKWDDVFAGWERETSGQANIKSASGLAKRYKRLEATVKKYGSLDPNEQQIEEYLQESGAQEKHSSRSSFQEAEDDVEVGLSNVGDLPRATTAGKTLNLEMMRAYLAMIDEEAAAESGFERNNTSVVPQTEPERQPSPPRDEDKCHWVYFVKRKVCRLEQSEDDVEWTRVGKTFTNLKRANVAAAAEFGQERGDVDVWPLHTWSWVGDDEKGLSHLTGTSSYGTVHVSVDRYLQTYQDGRLPETREGFQKKEVYIVFERTSIYDVIEGQGPNGARSQTTTANNIVNDTGEPLVQNSLSSIDLQAIEVALNGFDPDGANGSSQGQVQDESLDYLFEDNMAGADMQHRQDQSSTGAQWSPALQEPTWSFPDELSDTAADVDVQGSHEKLPLTTDLANTDVLSPYQQGPASSMPLFEDPQGYGEHLTHAHVSNRVLRTSTTIPLEAVYSVLDAANREAGRHYLALKRSRVPLNRRRKMDEILAAQKAEKEMTERLNDLRESGEKFTERIELEVEASDDDDSTRQQIKLMDIWVEERMLEVPRNI